MNMMYNDHEDKLKRSIVFAVLLSILAFFSSKSFSQTAVAALKLVVDESVVSLSLGTPRITFTRVKSLGASWSAIYTINVAISDASSTTITQVSCAGSFKDAPTAVAPTLGAQSVSVDCDYIGGYDPPALRINVSNPTTITISGSLLTTQVVTIVP